MVGGGTRASRPTEAILRPPKICRAQTKYLRADEGVRPYLLSQSLRLSPNYPTTTTYFDLKSVAGSGTQPQVSRRLFCYFFLRLKKVKYILFSFLKKMFVTISKVNQSGSAFSPSEKSMNSVPFLSKRRYLLLFPK